MYLHIGGNFLIKKDKIVAMIDLEKTKTGQPNRDFFKNLKNNQNCTYISEPGKEKTLIITNDGIFFSPISSITLLKRSVSEKVSDFS